MELSGSRLIPASQERTWNKLINPETLKVCITGCEKVERVSDHEYLVNLHTTIGPLFGHFQGRLQLSDIQPPHSYHLVFDGQAGGVGSAQGHADIKLTAEGDKTRLSYVVHADLSGKLQQLRTEQAEKVARKMTDNFFALFTLCAGHTVERPEKPPRVRAHSPLIPTGQYAFLNAWISRLSWLAVAGVIAALVIYHTFLR